MPANSVNGTGAVQADIAADILENVAGGQPPIRPELGRVGGVSWFVIEGTPFTSAAADSIVLPVEIDVPRGASVVEFRESDLTALLEAELPAARSLAEAQYRGDRGLSVDAFLNSRARNSIERNAARMAERAM